MSEEQGEFAVVYEASGRLAGEMIRAFLEAQGIPAIINQESAGATYGFTVGPLGLVDVMVPESRKEEAIRILEEMEEGAFEVDDPETGPSFPQAEEDEEL